ncbi:tetraspanin-18-like [Parasteatoda tepidariorum]|uniref:tetraspanin-18-like n=1 Tax=Parasteatoda tepidariorum TaxID=114398 RepID=UPI001C72296B|nr:tetraspanin-6-like [Parasteatoda tepidariorum]
MKRIFRRSDTYITADEQLNRIMNALLLCSGLAVIACGTYVGVDSSETNTLLSLNVLDATNTLFLLSGCLTVIFSIFSCFDVSKPTVLCLFSYVFVIVFVLQCMVSAVSFAWRVEIEYYASRELSDFIEKGDDASVSSKTKFAVLNNIQLMSTCCGARGPRDWNSSNWVIRPFLPYSCCSATVKECSMDKLENVHSEGCLTVIIGSYRIYFLMMGLVSLSVSVFQLVFFHAVNYVMFYLKSSL